MAFIWKSLDSFRRLFQQAEKSDNCLLVAAIDFGTTYSGWGFSFNHDFQTDPTHISTMNWSDGKTISQKGPTCILIKPDGKTIDTFGFEAEKRYSELIEKGEHTKWFYFHRFKMMLWNKPINKDTMLDDECGKSLPALTVFALSIRYMMDALFKEAKTRVDVLNEKDIYWVLTVPAIWNDSAKHFMRLAAHEAGIEKEKLTIALEPEVASILCRHAKLHNEGIGGISALQLGKKYLVVDAGGGTIDMTVHEVCFGGALKELHKATGGPWGGTMVDKAFLDFIAELIGKDALNGLKDQHKEDYIDLISEFEITKRNRNLQSDGRVTIRIPQAMVELVNHFKRQPLQNIIQNSCHAKTESIDKIVEHVSELLKTPEAKGVDTILMVGGFSESTLLQDAMRKGFHTLKIIVPSDAGLAVLKGAVMFGQRRTFIKERVSKFTYGINITTPFDEKKHPVDKRKELDIGVRCADIFEVMVKAGQRLVVGEKQYTQEMRIGDKKQSHVCFRIYTTEKTDVKFVTDAGCTQIGSVILPVSGSGLNRSIVVRALFGGTEIMVEIEDKSTGCITRTYIDCLS
ncbi:heat shock 70 kDa protein 12B-like isoform X2 [Dreissena polymorpha]|uniref:heat shock 70 kDa protein 12B-like isoform X2 n=1 Tax=Dreissena polymorpha TaxID=45954 RepID=UPI0022646A80|nr:heat shock 70 kDa protein 12B-like isoform X2 [Dreissena polymorpha]